MAGTDFTRLNAFEGESLNAVIETARGSRNKFKYDPELGLFRLAHVLPAGAVFPFDFGFVPSTRGEDGDPLDVLVLMDEPAFPGCLIAARLLGVIEAEQSAGKKMERNDRLIAVAAESHDHFGLNSIEDLNDHLLDELEHFFVSYNRMRGKEFRPLGRSGPEKARRLVEKAMPRRKKAA